MNKLVPILKADESVGETNWDGMAAVHHIYTQSGYSGDFRRLEYTIDVFDLVQFVYALDDNRYCVVPVFVDRNYLNHYKSPKRRAAKIQSVLRIKQAWLFTYGERRTSP